MEVQDIQTAITKLPFVYQQRGLCSATSQVCQLMVEKNLERAPEAHKAIFHLCIALCFIDAADGHTTTCFEQEALESRLATLYDSVLDTPNQSVNYDVLSKAMHDASSHLLNFRVHNQTVFSTVDTSHIQFARMTELETLLAQRIKALSAPQRPLDVSALQTASHLTSEQSSAVLSSIQNRISVITGGPGTGKTSIIVELLRCVCTLGILPHRIALAAPTGKAAYRMGESIQRALNTADDGLSAHLAEHLASPMTIHRLLDYRPWSGLFGRHEEARIKADLIIIDEMSMVDAELALSILNAVGSDTRLVLLGDPGQLPSVGVGAVLRDLVNSPEVTISTLTKSFRMNESDPAGSKVYQVSRWLLDAHPDLLKLPSLKSTWAEWIDAPSLGVHFTPSTPTDITQFIDGWYERFYRTSTWQRIAQPFDDNMDKTHHDAALNAVFEHFGRARILCPTRVGPQGSIYLNTRFVASVRREFPGEEVAGFGLGDLVMCMRNDYKLELFNGDQGVVISRVDQSGTLGLWVAFEGGQTPRLYPLALMPHLLEHAFAITVHKSQGSEFETVALSLPEKSAIPVSRALVYTAVTRAKREVLILGGQRAFFDASRQLLTRNTGLQHRLSRPLADGSKNSGN
jgi:exodeoxyribonuclease V alpha subunit